MPWPKAPRPRLGRRAEGGFVGCREVPSLTANAAWDGSRVGRPAPQLQQRGYGATAPFTAWPPVNTWEKGAAGEAGRVVKHAEREPGWPAQSLCSGKRMCR